jgi:putative N6-adenine-specific DNA methylase
MPEHSPTLFGSDSDPRALDAARRHLGAAGVERWVKVEQADILEREAPGTAGVMIANPPYGERMGSEEELGRFYPKLGDALKKKFAGWRCFFFTADLRLPKLIRLEPSRRTPLWNGALECRLYEFKMVAGTNR